MGKNNSLEDNQLTFLQFDVDDWAGISDDDNFCILISLFDCYTWFRYWLVASVDTLGKTDNTVLLCEIQSHFKGVDGPSVLVDFYDFRVLKILKHLIIDVFS
jgi:hypothetical protein